MAATVQQDRNPTPTTTPKITRSGLSLAERIKVIEARKMGKSMRQVFYFSICVYYSVQPFRTTNSSYTIFLMFIIF